MSHVLMPFEEVPNPELRMWRQCDGYLLILGSSKGKCAIMQVDTRTNKVLYWAYYNISKGRPVSSENEEVSAMLLFRGIGNIRAMADGRVSIVTND